MNVLTSVPRLLAIGTVGLWAALGTTVQAQIPEPFPRQPIRIIVPFAAGGAPDIVARLIAQHASETIGRQVFVENITGAGGNVAMQTGARAAPDGYSLLMCTLGCASNLFLIDNLGWDPRKDLAPVMMAGVLPNVLVIGPSIVATSAKEFVDLARRKPGTLSMASSGVGSASHLAGEMFKSMAGLNILHVPYRGSAAALPDIMAGRIDSMLVSLPEALPFIQAGGLKALGVSSSERAAALPDIPAIAETAVPGYAVVAWSALFAPAGTSSAVIERLNAEFNAALAAPAVSAKLAEIGVQGGGGSPELAGRFLQSEIDTWGKLIKERSIKLK